MKKTDKGVAGLTILLSLVTMLFVIGLLVMIFALMGGEMRDATFTSTDATVTNESTGYYLNGTIYSIDNADAQDFTSFVITAVHNASNGYVVNSTNYTAGATGTIVNVTGASWLGAEYEVNVSYTYTYNAENTATEVMNDTTAGVSSVTDWYPIFIVIGAMVVLILLTVLIITAIRRSGLMGSGGA